MKEIICRRSPRMDTIQGLRRFALRSKPGLFDPDLDSCDEQAPGQSPGIPKFCNGLIGWFELG